MFLLDVILSKNSIQACIMFPQWQLSDYGVAL